MKIGVFDSGVGGKSVAQAIEQALPEHQIIFTNDQKNVPYGTKTPDQLLALVSPILQSMVDRGCKVIVIACNTVTTNIIEKLREQSAVPLVAIEPMVKPAAEQTKTNIIAICATTATLASKRYRELVNEHAAHLTILEPDCSEWAYMIEENAINHDRITHQIKEVCLRGADVIVLGCTHYHWIETEISEVTQHFNAQVLQPEQATIRQLKKVIAPLC